VSDVGSQLRRETIRAAAGLTPLERVELALALGDSDVALRCSQTGERAEEARSFLARRRQVGRRPSRSMAER
jgi:hypothetical protein